MQQRRSVRPTLAFVLLVVLAATIAHRFDVIGHVAYAFEKGRLTADREHLDAIRDADVAGIEQLSHAFSVVAQAVTPSVVHISAVTSDRQLNEQIRRMFPNSTPRRRTGTGSGVIIDAEGHIVTNNHVVDGAQRVWVGLSDGRRLSANVIGTDPKTDLAVIKIDADRLHAARFGDSDRMKIGYFVLAIGSPFRLDHTVSHGIISATERHGVIDDIEYQGFLQTDAPINPGNSGGPLINTRGEIVGINTAIATESGGHMGVGFAIPSNTVKRIAAILKTGKQVVRGYLGVSIEPITLQVAQTYGLEHPAVLISGVAEGGPAERAGVREGDILTAIDDRSVSTSESLQNIIADVAPGDSVRLSVLRGTNTRQIEVQIGAQPANFSTRASLEDLQPNREGRRPQPEEQDSINADESPTGSTEFRDLGFAAETVSPALSRQYELDASIQNGAIITRVDPLSDAYDMGLRNGHVITRVGSHRINNIGDFKDAMSSEEAARGVRVWVKKQNGSGFPMVLKAPL